MTKDEALKSASTPPYITFLRLIRTRQKSLC
jgi:hypothetical protein